MAFVRICEEFRDAVNVDDGEIADEGHGDGKNEAGELADDRSDDGRGCAGAGRWLDAAASLTRISVDRKDACDHLRHPVSAGVESGPTDIETGVIRGLRQGRAGEGDENQDDKEREVTWHDILAER